LASNITTKLDINDYALTHLTIKTPILGFKVFQGHRRTPWKARQHVPACNVFHARRVDNGQITTSLTPSFEGNLLISSTKCCRKKLVFVAAHSEHGDRRFDSARVLRTDGRTPLR